MRNEVYNFIQESYADLCMYEKESLRISMPLYLIKEIEAELQTMTNISKNESSKLMFCGIEVVLNYKNEVTVFYSDFFSSNTQKYFTLDLEKK